MASESTPLLSWSHVPRRKTVRMLILYMIPSTFRLRIYAVLSVLFRVLNSVLRLVPAYALKLAIDTFTLNLVNHTFVMPYIALFVLAGARVLSEILDNVREILDQAVGADANGRLPLSILDYLQALSMYCSNTNKRALSYLSRRQLPNLLSGKFLPNIIEVLVITAMFTELHAQWILIVTFSTSSLYFFCSKFAFRKWKINVFTQTRDVSGKLQEKRTDARHNCETVKIFGMERHEVQSQVKLKTVHTKKLRFHCIKQTVTSVALEFIKSSGKCIALMLASQDIIRGSITLGDFVLVYYYIRYIYSKISNPLYNFRWRFSSFLNCIERFEQYIELLNKPIPVQDKPDAKPFVKPAVQLNVDQEEDVQNIAAELRFENVSFLYEVKDDKEPQEDEKESQDGDVEKKEHEANTTSFTRASGVTDRGVHNLNFTVSPGKMLAIVGPSGVGKTTIIRLILRLYDPIKGSVSIDGTDISDFQQQSLRQHIGVVAKDTALFNDTLRHNISYGKPGATDEEIDAVVQAAALGPFISSLSDGLDTVIEERGQSAWERYRADRERGLRLSTKERQRVGIARCFIRDPYLILLDEATSSLDTKTEQEIQEQLREIFGKRTTVVVAHRLSTIMMADEILVMDKSERGGIIVERGNHTELLEKEGVYYKMWQAQTKVQKVHRVEQNDNCGVKEDRTGREEFRS